MRLWITLALYLFVVALAGLVSYEAVTGIWSWFKLRPGLLGWTLICLVPGILTLVGMAIFTSWFRGRSHSRPARLWAEGRTVDALREAARRGDIHWIKRTLWSMAPHNPTLRDHLILAVSTVSLLRGDVTDVRNSYIPEGLKEETKAHADEVLDGLFGFCHRLHLLERRGLRLVEEEAGPTLAALQMTTRQTIEARSALAQLTMGDASPQLDNAAGLVKSITWQARELSQLNQALEL